MNLSLLGKRYNIYIVSFILLSSLFGSASRATPACPIITNQFQGSNGVTVDTGVTGWSVDASALTTPHPTGYYFALKSNRFTATNLGGVGIVNSHVFSIAGYKAPQVSVKITAEGLQNSTEYIQFYYKLDGGAPVLVAQQNGNFGTLTFTSPVLSGNTVQLIIKIYDYNNGSGQNSNYYIERYDVFQTNGPCTPGAASISVSASASNAGAITCANSSVTLSASSSTTGLSYFWTGPNSYATTSTSPTVSTPGTYTVIVTTSSGWGTATVNVTTNTSVPANVIATTSGSLSCSKTSIPLTASSTTTGTTFSWTGPNSFTATGATASAPAAGTYIVTAKNPTTGCTATASVAVTSNTLSPGVLTIGSDPANATLTCTVNHITLSGSAATAGMTYNWSGPNNFNTPSSVATAFAPGTYKLTATNPASGCTSTASITILQDQNFPTGVAITPNLAQLTCSNPAVNLIGISSTAGVSYNWTGPNGFTATGSNTTVGAAGSYILSVTNPVNGCITTTTATINQNFTPPAGIIADNDGPLTCSKTTVTLKGSSTTPGVALNWTGPANFMASGPTATVLIPGTYTLTATNPANGCSSSTNTIVIQNSTVPADLATSSSSGSLVLTCTNPGLTLTASSSTPGISYIWTGPGGFAGNTSSIAINTTGAYTVTAINPANGCTSSLVTSVIQNTTPPALLATASNPPNATLTCANSSVALTASTAVTGANYSWTGPNNFISTVASATVTAPGTYTVTATDTSNGCFSTASVLVTQNIAAPAGVTTTANPATAQITCAHPNVVLTSSAAASGLIYSWSGPSGFTATGNTATVTAPGVYTVSVTDPSNGCVTTLPGTVTKNVSVPVGLAASASDVISCFSPSIDLQGVSTTPGATFSWAGPGGFTAASAVAETDIPGNYTLTVTNPSNGCTASTGTIVIADTASPAGVTASNSGPLTCLNTSVTLTSSSTTAGVDYLWVTPDNNFISGASTTVTAAGMYTIVVTNDANGCSSQAITTVQQNTIGCAGSSVLPASIAGSSSAMIGQDIAGDTTTRFVYKAYPNPFSTTSFIEFTAPVSSLVTVEIYSSYGSREKLLFNNRVTANQAYKLELNAAGLSSGTHFCIIRNNDKVYSTKLILIK